MKRKTKLSAKAFFILFNLLASLTLTTPEYVDCQSLFPDQAPDLLGISKVSHKVSPLSCLSILSASPSMVNHPGCYCLHVEAFSPQSIDPKTGLAAFIRC